MNAQHQPASILSTRPNFCRTLPPNLLDRMPAGLQSTFFSLFFLMLSAPVQSKSMNANLDKMRGFWSTDSQPSSFSIFSILVSLRCPKQQQHISLKMYPVELYPGLDGVFSRNAPERTVFRVAWKAFQHKLDVCVEGIQGDCTADVSQEER